MSKFLSFLRCCIFYFGFEGQGNTSEMVCFEIFSSLIILIDILLSCFKINYFVLWLINLKTVSFYGKLVAKTLPSLSCKTQDCPFCSSDKRKVRPRLFVYCPFSKYKKSFVFIVWTMLFMFDINPNIYFLKSLKICLKLLV